MPNIAPLIFVAALMFCALSGVTLLAHIYNLNNIKAKTVGDSCPVEMDKLSSLFLRPREPDRANFANL
ncbi:hypothetical protein AALA61_11010 [Oscillospiraceae bacterium 42-9]